MCGLLFPSDLIRLSSMGAPTGATTVRDANGAYCIIESGEEQTPVLCSTWYDLVRTGTAVEGKRALRNRRRGTRRWRSSSTEKIHIYIHEAERLRCKHKRNMYVVYTRKRADAHPPPPPPARGGHRGIYTPNVSNTQYAPTAPPLAQKPRRSLLTTGY